MVGMLKVFGMIQLHHTSLGTVSFQKPSTYQPFVKSFFKYIYFSFIPWSKPLFGDESEDMIYTLKQALSFVVFISSLLAVNCRAFHSFCNSSEYSIPSDNAQIPAYWMLEMKKLQEYHILEAARSGYYSATRIVLCRSFQDKTIFFMNNS